MLASISAGLATLVAAAHVMRVPDVVDALRRVASRLGMS
jgi:hypothetical protein